MQNLTSALNSDINVEMDSPYCLNQLKTFLPAMSDQRPCQGECLLPLYREKAPSAVHNEHFELNVINKLQVRCSERENGCQWEGPLDELQCHLTQCQYTEEDCPCKCGDGVQCRDLEEHKVNLCPQRPVDCGNSEYHGTYREVTDQHWSVCMSLSLTCPNNCGTDNIPRGQQQAHCDTECSLQEVSCDFSHVGCKVQVISQDLSKHMSDAAQLHMALVPRALLHDKVREIAQLKQQLITASKQ